jgi:uncharacterized membrane protein
MSRYETPLQRALYPPIATAAVLASCFLAWHTSQDAVLWKETLESAGASIAVLGKFIVLKGLQSGSSLGPYGLALLVFVIDVNICIALTSGVRHLERAPGLGRWIRIARRRAKLMLSANPGLKKMAFFGVTLFVFLPLPATGAVMGTFAARLIGLSRIAGLGAVALGAGGIGLAFAALGELGKSQFGRLGFTGLISTTAIAGFLGWLLIRRVRRILQAEESSSSQP